MKKQKILFILTILFCLSFTHAKALVPSKNYVLKPVKTTSAFHTIQVDGSPDVEYSQTNGQTSVSIYGSDNLAELLDVKISNGILIIKFKRDVSIQGESRLRVIASSPELKQVDITGSGDIELKGSIKGSFLEINIKGSGDIEGNYLQFSGININITGSGDVSLKEIKSKNITAQINGTGDVTLAGKTKSADFKIAGSGDIDAEGLQAYEVNAWVKGSGDIECYATQELNAYVSSSKGDIEYGGNPKKVYKKGYKENIQKK